MKRILIKIGVLGAVFAASLLLFVRLFGGEDKALALQMEEPTFPVVSFCLGEYEFNTLHGYTEPMDAPTVRESITPTDGRHGIEVFVTPYGNSISAIDYKVTSLNGKKVWEEGTVRLTKVSGGRFSGTLRFSDAWKEERETVLELKLGRGSRIPLYYYTRLTMFDRLNAENNIDFAKHFHDLTLDPEQENTVEAYLETDINADNGTLYQVGVKCTAEQVMWGDLKIDSVSDLEFEMTEINDSYAGVVIRYSMRAGDNEHMETYDVKETYRVRPGNLHFYVLNFDRTMELRYETKKEFLGKNGLDLGMVSPDADWQADTEGNYVAYAVSDSIWQYDVAENEITKVFSFRKERDSDCRDRYDAHHLQILHQNENGDMSFLVSGYMNSGAREGQTGLGIYYYNAQSRTAELVSFLRGDMSGSMVIAAMPELTYYSTTLQKAYILISDSLYEYDTQNSTFNLMVEGLGTRTHTVSPDGRYLAYPEHAENPGSVTVFDLETSQNWYVTAPVGEELRLYGFIDRDLVYGIARGSDAGTDILGDPVYPAYILKIIDMTGTVMTEYVKDGFLLGGASCSNGLVTIDLLKADSGHYCGFGQDYIASSEVTADAVVTKETYNEVTRQRQVRLLINQTLREQQPRRVAADLLAARQEEDVMLPLEENALYAYAGGEVLGIFTEPGQAIAKADAACGNVTYADGNYMWERGNRDESRTIEGIVPIAVSTTPLPAEPEEPQVPDTDGDGIIDSEDPDADGDGYYEDEDEDNIADIWDDDKDGNGVDDIYETVDIPDTVTPVTVPEIHTVAAAVQMALNYFRLTGDADAGLAQGNGVKTVLEDILSGTDDAVMMDVSGTTPDQLCYLIGRDCPVIAMIDADHAFLMTGYDAYGVSFVDPTYGTEGYMTLEETEEFCRAGGGHYLVIVPKEEGEDDQSVSGNNT